MPTPVHAFPGSNALAAGDSAEVAASVRASREAEPILAFDHATGAVVDLDLDDRHEEPAEARGRGRPKLGVIGREATPRP